jgi:hypothetical protein
MRLDARSGGSLDSQECRRLSDARTAESIIFGGINLVDPTAKYVTIDHTMCRVCGEYYKVKDGIFDRFTNMPSGCCSSSCFRKFISQVIKLGHKKEVKE